MREAWFSVREWLGSQIGSPLCVLCGVQAVGQGPWPEGTETSPHPALCNPCATCLPLPPTRCPVCGIAQILAETCGACLANPPAFQRTVVGMDYQPPFDRLIQRFKFHAEFAALPFFVAQLIAQLQAGIRAVSTTPTGALPDDAILIPIPLSTRRLRERGYNQAALLAEALGPALQYAVWPNALKKVQDTPPQSSLPRQARLQSLRHAFQVTDSTQSVLTGKNIWLVDDVMTTGNTLNQAAQVLRDAGAAWVGNLVVSRTPVSNT